MEYKVLNKKHKCRNERDTEDLYFERGTCNGHEILLTEGKDMVMAQVMFGNRQWARIFDSWETAKKRAGKAAEEE